jgi:hypothetical protein
MMRSLAGVVLYLLAALASSSAQIVQFSGASVSVASGYPGQSGNPVGYAATPANVVVPNDATGHVGAYSNTAYPGSLTTFSGSLTSGTAGNPTVYAFDDFNPGTGGTLVNKNYITFIGCRFQSNSTGNYNVQVTGTNITFSYSSVVPLVSLESSPPNGAWPSAGAGLNINVNSAAYTNTGGYSTPSGSAFQYGINITAGGPVTADHLDIWGYGNAIVFYSTTAQMVVNESWIHDPAYSSGSGGYHQDGPGYLNGGTAPTNVAITNNTIGGIGNTNAIAFQQGTGYNNIVVTGNYISGFGETICMGWTSGTNLTFENNVIGSDIQFAATSGGALVYTSNQPTWGSSGNVWLNNTFNFVAGTTNAAGTSPSFSSADQGYYVLPNNTLSATDF